MTLIETDHDSKELLPLVGAALRQSPLGNKLAAYVDRNDRLHVIMRQGIFGIPEEHETVVIDIVTRLIREADASLW